MSPLLAGSFYLHRALIATILAVASAPVFAATVPFAVPPAKYEVRLEKSIMVPMRDGVRVSTDLYLPQGAGDRLPVIVVRLHTTRISGVLRGLSTRGPGS